MAEMLLLNPRRRRKAKKAGARRSNPKRRRSVARRRNPLPMFGRARRRVTRSRRRRNPIGLGGITGSSIIASIRSAMTGAVGAVAVDLVAARVMPMLPATLRPVAGKVGAGDAVKMLMTIVLGRALSRPTRGLSMKMAEGALVVQAHGIVKSLVPASFGLSDADGVGYWSPAAVDDGSMRVGPAIEGVDGMDEYVPGTALLSEYTEGGQTPLLNGLEDAFAREGVSPYR